MLTASLKYSEILLAYICVFSRILFLKIAHIFESFNTSKNLQIYSTFVFLKAFFRFSVCYMPKVMRIHNGPT
jgi:hypothetical protein